MCELFALSSKYPCQVKLSLDQFVNQAGSRNKDGWGLANLEGKDAYIYREPISARSSQLAQFLAQQGIYGKTILSHVRHSTVGAKQLANTHPFSREAGGNIHLFAFNGDVPNIMACYNKPKRFQVMGDTDAEWAFCLLLEHLHSVDFCERSVIDIIHKFGCELADLGPCNFLYAVNDRIYAFASKRRYSGIEKSPGLCRVSRKCKEFCHSNENYGLEVNFGSEVDQQVILFASIPLTDEKWQPFAVNELVCVSRGQIIDKRLGV